MDQQSHTYAGKNGTLIISPEGVTIKRDFAQALSTGSLTKREIHIPYQHLDKVMHQHAGTHPGYLQFATKPGTPGHTAMHRTSKIHFGQHHSHDFRRAKDLIDARVREINEAPPTDLKGDDHQNQMTNPFTGDAITR